MPTGSQPVVLLLHHDHRRNLKMELRPGPAPGNNGFADRGVLLLARAAKACSRRESHPHFGLRRAASYLLDDANVNQMVSPARLSLATLPFEAGRSGN